MSVFSSLNDKLGAERERLVHVEEELLHGRVALDEHALGHVDHDGGGGGNVRKTPRGPPEERRAGLYFPLEWELAAMKW